MKLKQCILVFVLFMTVHSCGDYTADILDPRLPAYTTSGAGIGGAYMNDKVWRNVDIPATLSSPDRPGLRWRYVLNPNDSIESTRISFVNGFVGNEDVEIDIYMFDLRISNKSELSQLENIRVDLSGNPNYANVLYHNDDGSIDTLKSNKGAIYFRHIEYKENLEHTIVAGTFGFEAQNDSALLRVKSGRYDFSVGDNEFYPY